MRIQTYRLSVHLTHLSGGTVELHMTTESWDLGNIERYQNVEGRQVLWEQTGWILEAQSSLLFQYWEDQLR